MTVLKIGTRRSALALWQANDIAQRLRSEHPDLECELVEISTKGDRITDVPLWSVDGKAFFTREIDDALLAGTVDLAVHSLKDLPTTLPDGILLAAVTEREDARDAWLSRDGSGLLHISPGSRVATSSRRRQAWILRARPDLKLTELRGNVPTRVEKLHRGECDAVVLAMAGLIRLQLSDRITEPLSTDLFPPAPGQGAVAVCVRESDQRATDLVRAINHQPTAITTETERLVLEAMGGGCHTPLGVTAKLTHNSLSIDALLASPGLDAYVEASARGGCDNANKLVAEVVSTLKAKSHRFRDSYSAPDQHRDRPVVIVTRAEDANGRLSAALRDADCRVLNWPVIETADYETTPGVSITLDRLDDFDWLVITSPRAATALVRAVTPGRSLPRLALVGQESERRLKAAGLTLRVDARAPSARKLAEVLVDAARGEGSALFLAGNLAPDTVPEALRSAGIDCVRLNCYVTRLTTLDPVRCRGQLNGELPDAVSFASPSAVLGFNQALPVDFRDEILRGSQLFAMGESTADAIRMLGCDVIATEAPSLEGFARQIREWLLSGGSR